MTKQISIITPSYNMLAFLKLCAASVADQEGVAVEHIVIDGGSTDGTVAWLKEQKNITWISEKDNGMYDAINKGLKLAKGEILAYLNCDEQYLPGTLKHVKDTFDREKGIDFLYGDVLIVNSEGELLCYKKSLPLRKMYIETDPFYVFSCTLFYRREIFDKGYAFNAKLRDNADYTFIRKIYYDGLRFYYSKSFLSTFTYTSSNMSTGENAKMERRNIHKQRPFLYKFGKLFFKLVMYLEKLLTGKYFQTFPLSYEIFVQENPSERKTVSVQKGTFRYPKPGGVTK